MPADAETPRRILVVDDDPDVAESLAVLLRHMAITGQSGRGRRFPDALHLVKPVDPATILKIVT